MFLVLLWAIHQAIGDHISDCLGSETALKISTTRGVNWILPGVPAGADGNHVSVNCGASRFASGRTIGIGQTRVVRLRKVSARPSTFGKCSSRSKWQCLGTPRRGRRDRRLRGNIAGEVVGKAPCARLAKEWAQRKLSTPPPARSHATDNALQAPAASSAKLQQHPQLHQKLSAHPPSFGCTLRVGVEVWRLGLTEVERVDRSGLEEMRSGIE